MTSFNNYLEIHRRHLVEYGELISRVRGHVYELRLYNIECKRHLKEAASQLKTKKVTSVVPASKQS